MAVTIKDVAKLADVAPSTVSRVIANSPRISDRTKEAVREAMNELGYHPNFNARSLANQSTKTIGVVMPNSANKTFQNPFFPEVIRGISSRSHQLEYGLYLSTGQTEDEIFEEVQDMVLGKRVDGIILLYSRVNDKVMNYLHQQKFPFTVIGRPYEPSMTDLTYVNNDNFKAAKTVTEYLLLLGHEKIAFIGGNLDFVVTVDHMEGYRKALTNAGIDLRDEYVVFHEELQEGGQEAVIDLMSLAERPTALIVADDIMTFGVMRMLAEMEMSVPDDVSIISFNNVTISELSSPPMTTVDINIFSLGYEAASCLIDLIHKPGIEPKQVLIPHKMIKRQTCQRLTPKLNEKAK
ncbi:LacI family DNA-binding transcriptional regulator [Salisediminibacterium halotolerans]|uniref:DNA-binding transcriptional regulator, LacI/PurR family n=1 Tax=Salisediminibacterium halotolerans TaxID=517425 RepID=A0A1H9VFB0_9BACI|nr:MULTISPECIES: LacI family DNA-binding transcriptional regulator [Salisediminibacterium]RLJ74472.1 LacI family transcriptional regulator [Actinophytocola xinjiangensis]RPE87435.1 LacI family transcriptional regulator [Salisediminibacterium halotolerans]TWG35308.1 LacI family transcriptional regulator [Salisediminibacterium halotolerans]SES20466.1 DNA-binding transcriptional regulator, LacI/PurR family [Salisediminibacterium haloalkalitolerans]GEL07940.1 LacI family transcriptional regulator 